MGVSRLLRESEEEGAIDADDQRISGILIRMYFNDPPPPHFHAPYNEHEAVLRIEPLEVLEGSLPRRALGLVFDWAELHRAELLNDWELCRAKRLPLKMDPLE